MLRCLFATSGSAEDLRSAVNATRQSTLDAYLAGHEFVDEYLQGDNPFPERLHANLLWMALVRDLQLTIIDWADETLDLIATWEDSETGPGPDAVVELLQSLPRPGRARGFHDRASRKCRCPHPARRPRIVVAGLGDTGVLIATRLARTCDVVGISTRPALVSGQELGTG